MNYSNIKQLKPADGSDAMKETGKMACAYGEENRYRSAAGRFVSRPKVQTHRVKKEKTVFDIRVLYELSVLIWTAFAIWLISKRGLSSYVNPKEPFDTTIAAILFLSPIISYILIRLPKIPYISTILCAAGGFVSGCVLMIPLIVVSFSDELYAAIIEQPFWIMYPLTAIACFMMFGLCIINAITAVKLLD